ncbi:MAG TPA: hypothetical protein DC084_22195 [Cupriavidus sp.]|nr:hypothetical protein [Cupriavidus sp.]
MPNPARCWSCSRISWDQTYPATAKSEPRCLEDRTSSSTGTDGSACDHRQDMFEQMKQSILVQRLNTLDPSAATAEQSLEMTTREGARHLGSDAGVLVPGKFADIAVIDLQ